MLKKKRANQIKKILKKFHIYIYLRKPLCDGGRRNVVSCRSMATNAAVAWK